MAVVNRGTKAGGGTDFTAGDTILAEEVNDDLNLLYTLQAGNIDSSNLHPTNAGITSAQLLDGTIVDDDISSGAGIDPLKVNDYSNDLAESISLDDPGDSDSPLPAESLAEELEQIRYALKRLGIGLDAQIVNTSTDAAWYDRPAHGRNLLRNPCFVTTATDETEVDGWTSVGTAPTTVATATLASIPAVEEGAGNCLNILAGAAGRGMEQTFTPKASSRYLVEARVLPGTQICTLQTAGANAASTFDDLDIDSANGGGVWETLSGIIETDATPTNIDVQLVGADGTSDFHISHVNVFEMTSQDRGQRGGNVVIYRTSASTTEAIINSDLAATVTVPGPGYAIRVTVTVSAAVAGFNGGLSVILAENIDGGGAATVETGLDSAAPSFGVYVKVAHFVPEAVAGSSYAYTIASLATFANYYAGAQLVVELLEV